VHWQYTPFTLPSVIAAAIAGTFAVIAWGRRSVTAAKPFALTMLAITIWSLAYVGRMADADQPIQLFWLHVMYLGIVTLPVAFLAFALAIHRQKPLADAPQCYFADY